MTRAVLAFGSNLGDSVGFLRAARRHFSPHVVAASHIFRTPPVGPVAQGEFLNAVLLVDSAGHDAAGWLAEAQQLEKDAGRLRDVPWGPRTLDVDVIAVWGSDHQPVFSATDTLRLPHPEAHRRAFVLQPWLDADPAGVLPGKGRVADLLAALPATDRADIERCDDLTW